MTEAGTAAADLSSNEPERLYAATCDLAHRKRLGQFFTPFAVARFMSQWLPTSRVDKARILDPCAGLAVFERALMAADPDFARKSHFTLWEKDESLAPELGRVCDRLSIDYSLTSRDFLDEHHWSASYDAVIANPPYYKHHFVQNKQDLCAVISSKVGATFSVQTNVYCWFLIKALSLLKPGGRLAFIIPTEFLNANYGVAVKKHLLEGGFLRHLISVNYESKIFDDAITTACVVLAEKRCESSAAIRFYRADSSGELGDLHDFLAASEYCDYLSAELDVERKWRSYFPGQRAVDTRSARLVPFSAYGRFSRGIATGANEFFALRPSVAADKGLPPECLIPCLSKAKQAPGKIFTRADFEALRQADQPVYLFDGEAGAGEAVDRYLRSGEASGFQRRYLTKTRKPWYALERRRPARIWAGVFGRRGIRFIWNESEVISLTCFHVYYPSRLGEPCLPILFLYLNSSTGRSFLELEKREYGEGLEKYEPNDINKAMAPDFRSLGQRQTMQLTELQKAYFDAARDSSEEQTILESADAIFSGMI